MAEPVAVPEFRTFSPTKRVDVLLADWKAELAPERRPEELEREVYGRALEEYLDGDYAFGLWGWFECDRLTNAFGGKVAEVTRVVGEGRYLGFSHRRAISQQVPLERVYQPRKGDMSTPRPEAIVLAPYQRLCVYAVRASGGDTKSRAQLEIALSELGERRRADPYIVHFETFRKLLERSQRAKLASASAPRSDAP
ncbi:MAG: hypothetical protein L3J95_04330 [Thermoplasmata archaeon]|nr:hypothetical protein [Thermoplasmata archaeon]MCI4359633.1 hypothetical protein [Thermoplasmata archaeon]